MKVKLFVAVLGLIVFLAACSQPANNTPTRGQTLDKALAELMPELENYRIVKVDDEKLIEELKAHAARGSRDPLYIPLPIMTAKGEVISDYEFTIYPNNLRPEGGIEVIAFDPENERGKAVQFLEGPSLTFSGFPDVEEEEFLKILEQAKGTEYNEALYQPSTLAVIGRELEASYFGIKTDGGHSVLQGLRSVLETVYGEKEIEEILSKAEGNYLLYNQAAYDIDLIHIDESVEGKGQGVQPTVELSGEHDHNNHDHSINLANHISSKRLNVIPVADDTIYNPDTNTWLYSNWVAKMESAGNKMNAYYWLTNIGPDIPASASSLSSNNNRVMVRARIPEMRVLTSFGKSLMDGYEGSGFSSYCGGNGSYRDSVRRLSNSSKRYNNEYWLWSTRRNTGDGGCSYTQVMGLSPRGTSNCGYIDNRSYSNCGAVGYINLRSSPAQDWISATFMHETGHALNGRHDSDAFGNSGQTWSSHRCTFLGIWNIGPSGPSLMSYASGTETYCFARSDSDGSPKKNVTLLAEFLHGVLQ